MSPQCYPGAGLPHRFFDTPINLWFQRLPADCTFLSQNAIAELPPLVRKALAWPSKETIEQGRPEAKNAGRAQCSTVIWLGLYLQQEWLNDKLESWLVPVMDSFAGADALWVRYRHEGYAFHVVSDHEQVFVLCVRPLKPEHTVSIQNADEIKKFVSNTVAKLFKLPDFVRTDCSVTSCRRAIASGTVSVNYPPEGHIAQQWRKVRQILWWTDGCAVVFWVSAEGHKPGDQGALSRSRWLYPKKAK